MPHLRTSSVRSTAMNDDEPILRRETAYPGIPRDPIRRTFTDYANLRAFNENQPPTSAFIRDRQDVPRSFGYTRVPLQPSHTVNTPAPSRAPTPTRASPSGTKESIPEPTFNKQHTEEHSVSPNRPDSSESRQNMPTPNATAPSAASATPEHEDDQGDEHDEENEDDSLDERLERVRNGIMGEMSPIGSDTHRLAMRASYRGSQTSLDEKYRGPCSTPADSLLDLSESSPSWRRKFAGFLRQQAISRERVRFRNVGIAVRKYYDRHVENKDKEEEAESS